MASSARQLCGSVHAKYKLIKYHKVSGRSVARTDSTTTASEKNIPATHPSASRSLPAPPKLARYFSSSEMVMAKDASNETGLSQIVVNRKRRQPHDIAIVGMAGRYPKANNLSEMWENLMQGKDCIEDIPADRYERRLQFGSIVRYRGGFIEDVDKFDSLFFNISPREAE